MKVKSKLRVSNLICIVIFPPAVTLSRMFFNGNFLLEYENTEDSILISPVRNLWPDFHLQCSSCPERSSTSARLKELLSSSKKDAPELR